MATDWTAVGSGAASGAAAGAALGPWGAAGGAVIGAGLGYLGQRGGDERKGPQIAPNPYLSQWNALIGQLQKQASGYGPSLAGNAFRAASAAGMKQQAALSHSGSAGGARQAAMNMAQINQGQAQGYANAKLAEQLQAQQSLQGALQGASNSWMGPQAANLQAQMQTPTEFQKQMAILSEAAKAAAILADKKKKNQAAGTQAPRDPELDY